MLKIVSKTQNLLWSLHQMIHDRSKLCNTWNAFAFETLRSTKSIRIEICIVAYMQVWLEAPTAMYRVSQKKALDRNQKK